MVLDSVLISIQLLGPLSASLETHNVTPNAAKQREVLALLALNAGRIVTVSTVIGGWGGSPPPARAGRGGGEAGDPQAVSELLGRALDLWRGPALVDVRQGRILETEAASLEETRLGVLERRIHADLALHRHGDILGELTMLAAQHPMNENFRGFLMK